MKDKIIDILIHDTSEVHTKKIGKGTKIWQYCIILGDAQIGFNCNINCHVFIENEVYIGDNCTIKSGVQLWDGITIKDNVFIGPNTTFANDKYPTSKVKRIKNWQTLVEKNVSIGANSTILPGIKINENAIVGAGSVITKDVPRNAIVAGNPAKIIGYKEIRSAQALENDKIFSKQDAYLVDLPTHTDLRGSLTVAELKEHIPFEIKRLFWTYDVPSKETRGEHSHKICEQFLICVSGSLLVETFKGKNRKSFQLSDSKKGLYIPPGIWASQREFTKNSVLLVLASHEYDSEDYIRDYDLYIKSLDE